MGRRSGASPRRIAILAPMPSELRPLVRSLSLQRGRCPDRAWLSGEFAGVEIVATTTGIGTRAAARTAASVLDATHVDHLVVVGVAGGIGTSLGIGDLVVPERVIDLATGAQYRPARLGDRSPRGALATSDELLADADAATRLEARGILAIDMETAAIAAVCEARSCDWSVFRAISDRAGAGPADAAILGLMGPDGRPRLSALARFVLTRPWRIPQLGSLARGLHRATRAAASAVVRALQDP